MKINEISLWKDSAGTVFYRINGKLYGEPKPTPFTKKENSFIEICEHLLKNRMIPTELETQPVQQLRHIASYAVPTK